MLKFSRTLIVIFTVVAATMGLDVYASGRVNSNADIVFRNQTEATNPSTTTEPTQPPQGGTTPTTQDPTEPPQEETTPTTQDPTEPPQGETAPTTQDPTEPPQGETTPNTQDPTEPDSEETTQDPTGYEPSQSPDPAAPETQINSPQTTTDSTAPIFTQRNPRDVTQLPSDSPPTNQLFAMIQDGGNPLGYFLNSTTEEFYGFINNFPLSTRTPREPIYVPALTFMPLAGVTIWEPGGRIEGSPGVQLFGRVPVSASQGVQSWALLNLIKSIIGAALVAVAVIRTLLKKRKQQQHQAQNDEQQNVHNKGRNPYKKLQPFWLAMLSLLAALAILIFILTQDMRTPMVLIDFWTIVHLFILAGGIVSYVFVFQMEKRKY